MRSLSWSVHSERWRGILVVAIVIGAMSTACGTDDTVPEIGANEVLFYVSNQSFDDPNIEIVVTVDGLVVVDDSFPVGNQHNWVPHLLNLSPGEHRLRAESSTGAIFDGTFETLPGQPRWVVLNYWNEPEEEGRRFVLASYDEPVRFY